MVDLEQNGKRYTVSDKDFQDYLSRVCAGEDAAPAQDHPSTAALPSTDLSTPEKIAALLDAICASPAQSSNPSDYVAAHSAEYQKLINGGADTLLYCYKEFLKGGQTDLRGWIMAFACQSIADAWDEKPEPLENAVLTGWGWNPGDLHSHLWADLRAFHLHLPCHGAWNEHAEIRYHILDGMV